MCTQVVVLKSAWGLTPFLPLSRQRAGTNWGLSSVPGNVVMCMVCLCVLSTVAHLRTFSLNR